MFTKNKRLFRFDSCLTLQNSLFFHLILFSYFIDFVSFRYICFLTLQISFHFVGFRFLTLQISLDFVFVSFLFISQFTGTLIFYVATSKGQH